MRKRRSGLSIMGRLIVLIKPLWGIMLLAIFLGVIGYSCARCSSRFFAAADRCDHGFSGKLACLALYVALAVMAVSRGLLHYGEQYCNHFIAFRLLAAIRHTIFDKLRSLAPAKLEGKDKGNLISVITTDTELLEVFYAHTVSPIAIAVIVSGVVTGFIVQHYAPAAILCPLRLCGRWDRDSSD